jgi:HemY protein
MSFYRSLLAWLALAALGALAWELLSPDLGNVVVRWHGTTVTTTVAFALVFWLFASFLFWALWLLLRLPFRAWRRHAKKQARQRLLNGLTALHEGRHLRAETLLQKAAEDPDARSIARLAAREAALRRGDLIAAANQQALLARNDPLAAALAAGDSLLAQQRPQDVLDLLPAPAGKRLPPRALLQRGEALCALGRAAEALPSLEALRIEHCLGSDALAALERRWRAAALREANHADELQQRWRQLPDSARDEHELLAAYADRGAALGLEMQAADALADALDARWSDALMRRLARLPAPRDDQRLPRAERWLPAQSANPQFLLALGQLCRQQQLWGKAEDALNRAIAQGAGSEAWEELGHLHTGNGDSAQAQTCYANALRSLRGEAPAALGGRSLREQIAAEAVAEQRNEHGLPLLPKSPP